MRVVQANIREGYGWVVDMDLEAFFDRVNHDRLMAALENPGTVTGAAGDVFLHYGTARHRGAVNIFIEPPWYVTRMPGGVGGEAPPYPDWAAKLADFQG